ncbi:CheR family methyltransferase [Alkalimonas amylolytica]|uniref:MCP methyltransferase, CheR-type n=1 Tax=Alkalimonas amylolytica TaxID=152573 RepID=A0A1H3ZI66_ALKAM|nr:CheR family methyltransferase [Alkalimonas amylolytica]SEA23423.1 MCP methyltransferase, CheR-type [Alkalimonas amylolytica]
MQFITAPSAPSAPSATASAEGGLSADILRYCDALISARLGIHFPAARLDDLGWHIPQLLERMALPNVGALIAKLQKTVWPALFQQQLMEQLTVGETYFFRDPALFQYLRLHWLPALLAQRRRDGRLSLRCWSAGCCSGEELYSLAIVVHQLLPDAEDWDLQFIGTDINPLFLQCAKAGVYRSWSFRQPDSSWHNRYCSQDNRGHYHMTDPLRQGVSFFQLNLIEAGYPDESRQLAHCDLILCRNVLMYFETAQAGKIIRRLQQCLSTEGALLLTSTEAILCQAAGVSGRNWPGAVALQGDKPDRFAIEIAPAAVAEVPQAGDPVPHEMTQTAVADINQPLQQARRCANRGDYRQAEQWVQQALAMDKLQPASYWLLANIEWENNNLQAAIQAVRQALYLQPDFVLAHLLIGRFYDCIANRAQAGHHYAICSSLLEKLPSDAELEQGEGLTVAQCRQWLKRTRQARQHRIEADVRH